jgi:hypothetical protein
LQKVSADIALPKNVDLLFFRDKGARQLLYFLFDEESTFLPVLIIDENL